MPLTEVVVRADDTDETLKRKVEIATVLGTLQAKLTDFQFLGPEWSFNCREEALLGVSMTGIMDCKMTTSGRDSATLETILDSQRQAAIDMNERVAKLIGINRSTAITAVKPSGTVSQLVNSASGIHPRYSAYYIRTVRVDKKDPMYKFMRDAGIPCEDEAFRPDSTAVFSFPVASPTGALTRDNMTSATQQLELWATYQKHWTEHKPSITVYVRDGEWMEVGAWVWKNFDIISGVSFLPYDGGSYQQAPYQPCSKEEYEEASKHIPERINWDDLGKYEQGDHTRLHQEIACTGDKCEIVDLTS